MPRFTHCLAGVVPLLLWAGWYAFSITVASAPPAPEPIPAAPGAYHFPKAEFVGATSCAAASCHGGPAGRVGGEYATWSGQAPHGDQKRDPHSRAYAVLFNDVSRNIVRNLAAAQNIKPIPAHEHSLCLKCHAVPMSFPVGDATVAIPHGDLADRSVGCESCHGAAEHYLSEHFLPAFQGLSARQKAEQYGLYPTKDLSFRVQMCAKCHVGAPDREVNHDLIAAGHPRLMFEYASYQHHPKYQTHWTEKSYGNDFDLRAWTIGQVAAARAAASLLLARAERAEKDARHVPWPEFTEHSCYACHQDLGKSGKSWKDVSKSSHVPGSMPWGTWTMPALSAIEKMGGELGKNGKPAIDALVELRQMMENPKIGPAAIRAQCQVVIGKLDPWLVSLQQAATGKPVENIASLFKILAENALTKDRNGATKFNDLDWDGAVQHYLGLAALNYAGDVKNPDLERAMIRLRQSLLFPGKYNSPHAEKAAAILKEFEALRNLTQEGKRDP